LVEREHSVLPLRELGQGLVGKRKVGLRYTTRPRHARMVSEIV